MENDFASDCRRGKSF